jgi:hypothetical protein
MRKLPTDLIMQASAYLASMVDSPPEEEAPVQRVLFTLNNKIL